MYMPLQVLNDFGNKSLPNISPHMNVIAGTVSLVAYTVSHVLIWFSLQYVKTLVQLCTAKRLE